MDVNKLRREAQKLQGKAETFLKDHHDQIESGVTKAETFAKSKTKNEKRGAQIDRVAGKVREMIPSDQPKPAKNPEAPGTHKPKAADEGGDPGPSGLA
jgi:hypothetical protein